MGEIEPGQLDELNRKLDLVVEFVEKVQRHLPLLERLAGAVDHNPAARFLMRKH